MAITICCDECGYCTDIEIVSDTNPSRCPECGGTLLLDGTATPLYVGGDLNPVLFEGD